MLEGWTQNDIYNQIAAVVKRVEEIMSNIENECPMCGCLASHSSNCTYPEMKKIVDEKSQKMTSLWILNRPEWSKNDTQI